MEVTQLFSKGIDVLKKNPIVAVPLAMVGIIVGILTLVLVGGAVATAGMMGLGMLKPSMGTIGALVGGALLVMIISGLLNLLAMSTTFIMADDALKGSTNLNAGIQRTLGNIVNLVVAGILVGVIVFVGMLLLVIPGLVAAYLLMFTIPLVVLDNRGAVQALKESFDLVKSNVGDTIVFAVIAIVIIAVAGIIGGIFAFLPLLGTVIISPVISGIASAYIGTVLVLFYRELKK